MKLPNSSISAGLFISINTSPDIKSSRRISKKGFRRQKEKRKEKKRRRRRGKKSRVVKADGDGEKTGNETRQTDTEWEFAKRIR